MDKLRISCINFEDFVVINRQKLGSRALYTILEKYLKNNYGLSSECTLNDFDTHNFSFRNIFNFYISTDFFEEDSDLDIRYINNNHEFFTYKLPDINDIQFSNKKIELEFIKIYDVVKTLVDGSYTAMNSIASKTFDKPIIFIYKSPKQQITTSLIQDLDSIRYNRSDKLDLTIYGEEGSNELEFFHTYIFSEQNHMSKLTDDGNRKSYTKDIKLTNTYVVNWLESLKKSIREGDTSSARFISNMLPKLFHEHLINYGSIGSHRAPWLSTMLPLIEGNKLITFVNLDNGEINWQNLFKSISNKEYDFQSEEMINTNIKEDSNRSVTNFLKPYVFNDNRLKPVLYSFYWGEFFNYNLIKSDSRNYKILE